MAVPNRQSRRAATRRPAKDPAAVFALDAPRDLDHLLEVEVPGGRGTIVMRPLATARQFIALKKGDPVEVMELTVANVVEYLPDQDPLDLPPEDLLGLASNWITSRTKVALPPTKA
jgi:hypothetical protein